MKQLFQLCLLALMSSFTSYSACAQTSKYKCLLQMSNYMGHGAYITVSLINPQGAYVKTLQVMGEDKKWYKSLKEWYKFYAKKPDNISAITGASLTGGDRSTTILEINDAQLNVGYKLRFESAVENEKYVKDDVEVPLTTAGIAAKTEGKGHIKYVRIIRN
jgi:hypothetical protein